VPLPWPFQLFASAFDVAVLSRKVDLLMSKTDDLTASRDLLLEALSEITSKIDELLAAVASGEPVPQELVDEIKTLSQSLADIVPNPPAEA
jgi:uncharacterized protein YoxC